MFTFLAKYGIEILLGLISAGALALCKYFHSKMKEVKTLYEEKDVEALNETIDKRLEPIYSELDELRAALNNNQKIEPTHVNIILSSYRYRLKTICKNYIKQGYMTAEQYEQLTEFFKIYHDLGGNGQVQDIYEKVMELEIHE